MTRSSLPSSATNSDLPQDRPENLARVDLETALVRALGAGLSVDRARATLEDVLAYHPQTKDQVKQQQATERQVVRYGYVTELEAERFLVELSADQDHPQSVAEFPLDALPASEINADLVGRTLKWTVSTSQEPGPVLVCRSSLQLDAIREAQADLLRVVDAVPEPAADPVDQVDQDDLLLQLDRELHVRAMRGALQLMVANPSLRTQDCIRLAKRALALNPDQEPYV